MLRCEDVLTGSGLLRRGQLKMNAVEDGARGKRKLSL